MRLPTQPRSTVLPFPGGDAATHAVQWVKVREAIARAKRRFRPELTLEQATAVLDWLWWAPALNDADRFHFDSSTAAEILGWSTAAMATAVDRLVRVGILDKHDSIAIARDFRGLACPLRAAIDGTALVALVARDHRVPQQRRAALLATLRAVVVAGKAHALSAQPTIDVNWRALEQERALTRMAILPQIAMLERSGVIARDHARKSPPSPLRFALAPDLTRTPGELRVVDASPVPTERSTASESETPSASTTSAAPHSNAPRLVIYADGKQEMIAPEWTPAQFAEYARALRP